MTGAPLTRQQADAELARLDAERSSISAALVELDSHPGQRLLEAATLRGESKRRWSAAKQALAALHQQFEAYRLALDNAHQLRDERDYGALTASLQGEPVVLTGEGVPLQRRSLTGPSAAVERLGFAAVVDRMNTAFKQVTEVVAAADEVWSAVATRLDGAAQRLAKARQQAGELNLARTDRALAAELDSVAGELAGLLDLVASEPLSVPADAGERLLAKVSAVGDRVASVVAVRAGAADRLAAVAAGLEQLRALQEQAAATRQQVLVKIAESALPPVSELAGPLAARLTTVTALGESGLWRQLADELPALEAELDRARQRLRTEHDAIGSLLGRRDELRGRLEAYRAKAAALGHSEDLELERLYSAAHELLWTAPCDLPAATRALARYQQQVSARR